MSDIQEMQKITIELPKALLEQARQFSGKGSTQTIRETLKNYVALNQQKKLLELRGTLKRGPITIEEMRSWEDE